MRTQRLNEVIKYLMFKGLVRNQADLADKIGYNPSSMSQITTGRTNVSAPLIRRICKLAPEVSDKWILTGEGSMIIGGDTHQAEAPDESSIALRYLAVIELQQEMLREQQRSITKLVDKVTGGDFKGATAEAL